jgi:REP element-mobilizing transposase RayT
MSQSLSKLFIHAIFHVKNNECLIRPEDEKELYAYMGGVLKLSKSIPILINGTDNHIHVLCIMSKNISLANLLEEIKSNSSRWIKTLGPYYRNFA